MPHPKKTCNGPARQRHAPAARWPIPTNCVGAFTTHLDTSRDWSGSIDDRCGGGV